MSTGNSPDGLRVSTTGHPKTRGVRTSRKIDESKFIDAIPLFHLPIKRAPRKSTRFWKSGSVSGCGSGLTMEAKTVFLRKSSNSGTNCLRCLYTKNEPLNAHEGRCD